ncbi:MAG: hypothetical protein D6762_01640 [Candidatus Neomarinimicrobiota bacterium]|nr:MAG: hypothetical protein D6762_01640 [Candidatus Neomarinimicrobiota bacterium]
MLFPFEEIFFSVSRRENWINTSNFQHSSATGAGPVSPAGIPARSAGKLDYILEMGLRNV